jgi:hypothetical protein
VSLYLYLVPFFSSPTPSPSPGSLTTVAGNGGDVINGTGQPGSINAYFASGVSASGNSHINIQGAVTVNGGRGGNVNTGTALSAALRSMSGSLLTNKRPLFVGR